MKMESPIAAEWSRACRIEDIPVLVARVVQSACGNIAVFRNAEDEVFALEDRCPHKGGPLSQGIVHGRKVACPLHNWVINLEDGEATGADKGCARTFPVKLENGRIYLNMSVAA